MLKRKKCFTVVSAVAFVLVCVLIGTAADMPGKKVIPEKNRVIVLADSPVRIMLQGSGTYRISLDGKTYSRALPRRYEIRLRHLAFDPLVNPPPQGVMGTRSGGGEKLYIVQFHTQAIVPYQEQITAAGGEVSGTLPDHALLVAMSGDTVRKVRGMPFVRWVGPYHYSFKLEQEPDKGPGGTKADTVTHYSIWMTKKNKKKIVVDFIESIGGEVVKKSKSRRLEAKLNDSQLLQVADLAQVLHIDRWTPIEEDMNIVRDTSGGDYLETVQGYTGQGVRAEVCDGGLRATHVDFQSNPPLIHSGNTSSTSHGTPVTGIVFGDGTGDSNARGMIPDAQQPIFAAYDTFSDRYAHTEELVNPGGSYRAVFQTNSWGNTRTYYYTTISAEMDEIIFDLDILICQSQSNAGDQDSRPQAWAKNILSVGGLRHYNTLSRSDDCWCGSASIGPADDGRIKPDVWHFYDYTRAPYYTSDTSYTEFGGTSGATPITAGHMGLIFQMWADGVFDGGPGQNRDVFNTRPHFTTAKALVIHSAYQYSFSGTSDDKTRMHQGWGMPDVQNLYDMADDHNWGFPILIDESAVITPLETHTYTLNVDGSRPLKATLVYADPAGNPSASIHRINDLSLKVTAPNGTTYYWGNNGLNTALWSSSGGSSNTIDTVENVFIQTPAAGTWTIQVLADEVVQDGHVETGAMDADYALIVSGGTTGANPPPAAPTGLSAAAGDASVSLDWNDNPEPDLASYNVKRSTSAGGPYTQVNNVTVSQYNDTGLTNGVTYYYVVTAVDTASNESGNSNQASATPQGGVVEPPVADFTASDTDIDEGDSVTFTDTSTNNPTSWSWTFEGGTPGTSTAQNPTVTYNTEGTYNVTLTATNSAGSDGETKIDYITVTAPPPTVGNTTVFGSTSVSTSRRAMPFTMPENGNITSVAMYHVGGSGSMILGVYDGEGLPANRLGVTASTAINSGAGWQTINLTGPAYVAGGTTVWLAWVYESNPGIAYETGTPGRVDSGEGWSGGMPDPYGTGTQADFLYSIYAVYTPGGTLPQYTLTTNTVGQGSITLNPPGGTYDVGTVVTVTADPDTGWQFDNWSGDLSGSTNPTTITMDADKSVTANFSEIGTTSTVGYTTVFGTSTTSANRRAMPFTMPEDGTIESVAMYHTGGSGSMILGVYDGEGSPANRLGVTATTAVSGSTGWQTINLTSPAYVASGATVWLAWVYETNPGIAYQTGTPGRVDAGVAWPGGMPNPFGSSTQADFLYSIYATYTPGGTPQGTVGITDVYSSTSTSANRRAMPFTMPENGTISSVTMYHTGGSGSMILAVYDGEGTPANRLGVTATTTVSGSTGWQTINLTSPVSVTGGTTVWLAWVYESNPGVAYQTGSPGRYQSADTWSGGMPDPFGSGTQADYLYSIYATYTPD